MVNNTVEDIESLLSRRYALSFHKPSKSVEDTITNNSKVDIVITIDCSNFTSLEELENHLVENFSTRDPEKIRHGWYEFVSAIKKPDKTAVLLENFDALPEGVQGSITQRVKGTVEESDIKFFFTTEEEKQAPHKIGLEGRIAILEKI